MNNFYIITPVKDENNLVDLIPKFDELTILNDQELKASDIQFNQEDKVCILSETSLATVKSRLVDYNQIKTVELLKDKFEFRRLIKNMYPDYFFESVGVNDIQKLNISKKCVIKPQKGFFGTAVVEIDEHSDLDQVQNNLIQSLNKTLGMFPEEMLSTENFIVEQFIEGEEYAVDMFYDDKGNPVIVNLYHHPMPKHPEYLQMLYYSSKEIFDAIYQKTINFFTKLNESLQVKNIALHAEFRLNQEDFLPIEINPMRYGGMGLGTLVYHGMGLNPYQVFAENTSVDWGKFWSQPEHQNSIYAYMIAYNGKSINPKTQNPDIESFKKEFTQVLKENPYPHHNQLTFGTFVLKERQDNLKHILSLDFDDYFD